MTDKPVKLAILWHMHQPNYISPGTNNMAMPWVRLHGLKDYLDMPLLATRHDNVKVTFNLVPSLIDQLELYQKGGSDPHFELTKIPAEDLSENQKREILTSFFGVPEKTMIAPYTRLRKLYRKVKENINQNILPALFSSDEMRDIQIWANLIWIDPIFRSDPMIKILFEKQEHYTENDKQTLIEYQLNFLSSIIPAYRSLYHENKLDISFTPYYHPILPLLCDTDSAFESMPNVNLPNDRFMHPEDARYQIEQSVLKFRELFDRPLEGMWPSEGSVSEMTADLIKEAGLKWMASDDQILFHSLKKSNLNPDDYIFPGVYEYKNGLKIFFRDHRISDRIGFVYSSMEPEKAVDDFISNILRVREKHITHLDQVVIPIILDGENAWEYFPKDGNEFLQLFYKKLSQEKLIETVTFSQASTTMPSGKLDNIYAGSWINHNFRIWIGHHEDNQAWDLLHKTRKTLVAFEEKNPDYSRDKIKAAWNQIYIAEGSDWCWWYGEEHRQKNNELFDLLYRKHLMAVYDFLNLEIPEEFYIPIYTESEKSERYSPDCLLTPIIDGKLSHFYEWTGSGYIKVKFRNSAMHQNERNISHVYYAYDRDNVYFRLDLIEPKRIRELSSPRMVINLLNSDLLKVDFKIESGKIIEKPGVHKIAFDSLLELGINRLSIFSSGFGKFGISFTLYDGDAKIEKVPQFEPLIIEIPERNKEIFWPS